MSLKRPTVVLFDMDGTTVRHINPRLLGILEFADDMIFKMGRLFSKDDPAYSLDEEPKKKSKSLLVHRALHRVRRKPVEQIVQPCPGIYALLNMITQADIPLGVVSNGLGKGYGDDILEKFHLTQFFKVSIFREDFAKSKPHPDPILRALRDLKDPLTADDVIWYIGDRHKDITAALAADEMLPCEVMPFAYGLNASVAVLEKGLGPERIIMNYHDFTRNVRPLLEKKRVGMSGNAEASPKPLNDNKPLTAA